MKFEEFLKDENDQSTGEHIEEASENVDFEDSIDVQKAVVESLATEKAEQDEIIDMLRKKNENLLSEIETLKKKIATQSEELSKVGDTLARNSETSLSNKVALIDRNLDVPDRFSGETHDHVLEVIAEARERAEAEGRIRRAQLLESVLTANEKEGTLDEKRKAIEKVFAESGNIVSGTVIEKLSALGISYKNGNDYLLPSEIIKRVY